MKRFSSFLFTVVFAQAVAVTAAETFLAVGYGGRRMTSSDGFTWENVQQWTDKGADDGNNLMSAVFAQGKFVVVGGGGAGATGAGHILVSTNGKDWRHTLKDKARINPVVYGNGRFVVGASSYPSGKFLWSSNAESWSAGAKIEDKGLTHFRGGAFGNGVFVLVGNGSTKVDGTNKPIHWAVTTRDAEHVVSARTDLPGHGQIAFGNGHFLMLTSHTKADVLVSANGADWGIAAVPESAKAEWLVWTGTEFLIGAGKAGVLRTRDGVAWQKTAIVSKSSVAWSDGRRFISTGWPGHMSFSADGLTWKSAGQPQPAMGVNQVVRGEWP